MVTIMSKKVNRQYNAIEVNFFRTAFFVLAFSLLSTTAIAYETDQYSSSFHDLKDSTAQMDLIVNDAIEHVVLNWDSKRSDYKLLSRIAGYFHSRQFEKWVSDSTKIDSRNIKSDSIFKTTGWESSAVIRWKGLATSFSLNNVHVGADKLSHFFGVGWIYWKKSEVENKGKPETIRRLAVIDEGVHTENTYWGRLSTNIFSNADLVTNWEGYLFYRGLLEDNIVNGKKALIRWQGDRPIIQRPFSFKDHVNDFWSESFLPNDYDSFLAIKVKNVLRTYCDHEQFKLHPEKWVSKNFNKLWKKYSLLKLDENAIAFRMDKVCDEYSLWPPSEKQIFLKEQKETEESYAEDMNSDDKRKLDVTPVLGHIISRISSPIPTCNWDIESAINEHRVISDYASKFMNELKNKLKNTASLLHKNTKKTFRLDKAKLVSAAFFKKIFTKVKKSKIKIKQWENLYRSQYRKKLKINGKRVTVIGRLTNFGGEIIRGCLILPIPLKKSSLSVRKDFIKASLYHCIYTDINKNEIKSSTFWRASDKNRRLRTSLSRYFELEDREAYVYRMIPKICKWY